jgi:4-hydroxy-tetrahydrodipicolinate reductase
VNEPVIRVAVLGASGRMGREVLAAVSRASDMELVAAVDRENPGATAREIAGGHCPEIPVVQKVGVTLDTSKPDVVVDFTHLSAAPEHAMSCLQRKIPIVIGTSGLSNTDISAIRMACLDNKTPAAIIPNFAVGAVLMTRFAEIAAKWIRDVEIIERHHGEKLDAPSGTALHTAERIAEARPERPVHHEHAIEKVAGARGGKVKDIPVHSVRLPGYVASQEVVFGSDGELLTIRHDSIDRRCFMPGVLLSIRKIRSFDKLVVGLDKFML